MHQPRRQLWSLNIGRVNALSAVNKAAELYAVIHENRLDGLAVIETWFQPDKPETAVLNVAPPGCQVKIGAPRSDGFRGGGLAVIYRDHFCVILVSVSILAMSFEMQIVQLALAGDHYLITEIYRPLSTNLETFFHEVANLFDATASAGDIFVGVFNCTGNMPESTDASLSVQLYCYNVVAVNSDPMRLHSISWSSNLDFMIEPEGSRHLAPVTPTIFFDLSFLFTKLKCTKLRSPKFTYSYRNFRCMNIGRHCLQE